MKIYIVRHGDPDYKNDCLTELGHLQAEAVALRLKDEHFDKVYSSPFGRARETAGYIVKYHDGMDVELLQFMKEITWGPKGGVPTVGYNPWDVVGKRVAEGDKINNVDWTENGPLSDNLVCDIINGIADASDKWLEELGYTREGDYYRVCDVKYNDILIACHGGSSFGLISRLVNLPFSFMCGAFHLSMTGIIVIELSNEKGRLCSPVIKLFNDAQHINGISVENKYEM